MDELANVTLGSDHLANLRADGALDASRHPGQTAAISRRSRTIWAFPTPLRAC